jgi:DNA-binding MarR family transcriptional regulator
MSPGAWDSALSDLPGHLLRRCHQIAVGLFLEECGRFEVTPPQFDLLKTLLDHGPQDQAALGGLAALDRSTVAAAVARLEARGLVVRTRSSRDGRAKIVLLTGAGLDMLSDCAPRAIEAQTRITEPLEPEEAAELTRLLRKLAEGNNSASRAPYRPGRGEDG